MTTVDLIRAALNEAGALPLDQQQLKAIASVFQASENKRHIRFKRVETPQAKLIAALCTQIEKARLELVAKDLTAALVELEYAQVVIGDNFEQYPEIKLSWYRDEAVR